MATTSSDTTTLDPSRLHETRAPQLITALVLCPAISAILVGMRIYTRFVLTKKHFLEDYSIISALICSVAMSVFMGFTVIHGCGRHVQTVSTEDLTELLRIGIGTIQFYFLTHCFLKLSIMLQYYRVTVLPWEKHLCFGMMGVICAGYLALVLVQMVRCVPFVAQWTANYPGARCINATAFYFVVQALNMGLDLVILAAPLLILRHSNAPFSQKLLFGIALSFGGVACIIAILRFQTLVPSTTSKDPTWDKLPSALYGIIEPNLGIACACVVTLRPLLERVRSSAAGGNDSSVLQEGSPHHQAAFKRRRALPHDDLRSGWGGVQLDIVGSDSSDGSGGREVDASKIEKGRDEAAASSTTEINLPAAQRPGSKGSSLSRVESSVCAGSNSEVGKRTR